MTEKKTKMEKESVQIDLDLLAFGFKVKSKHSFIEILHLRFIN